MEQIRQIKAKLQESGKVGLALDIDETLSETKTYWMMQMQKLFGNPEKLSLHEAVKKYRDTRDVPYWQTEDALLWIEAQRNSNPVQETLPLIEQADIFVAQIHQVIPILLYVTARPNSVIEGTKKWLAKHKFPEATIIARPPEVALVDSSRWKAEVIHSLYPQIAGIIDDNSALLKFLPHEYKGVVFLYDHSKSPETTIRTIACPTWSEVHEQLGIWFKEQEYVYEGTTRSVTPP